MSRVRDPRPWYVYAIVGDDTRLPPGMVGFGGEALELVPYRKLAAVVSQFASENAPPDSEFLIEHETIVELICQHTRALPVRFRSILPDAPAISHVLAERYEVLEADLQRVGGHVELGLFVLLRAQTPKEKVEESDPIRRRLTGPSAGPGARYLAARSVEYLRDSADRLRAKASAADVKAELQAALRAHIVEDRYALPSTSGLALRATYLVLPDEVEAIRSALELLRRRRPGLRFILSGPWPPYSFVTPPRGAAFRVAEGLSRF